MPAEWLLVGLIGVVAGVLAGMFGIGGGVVIVPALTIIAGLPLVQASGTSLAALMMPVGIVAVIEYYRNGYVDIKTASFFALGLLSGVFFGAGLALNLPSSLLKQLYGVFLLWVSWRFIEPLKYYRNMRNKQSDAASGPLPEKSISWVYLFVAGTFAGVLSGLFGIGGGLVIVPIMVTFMHFHTKKAFGTSLAALLLPVALPGVIRYYNAGHINISYAAIIAGGIVLGSLAGAKITIALPAGTVKKIYAVFLIIMSAYFIFGF